MPAAAIHVHRGSRFLRHGQRVMPGDAVRAAQRLGLVPFVDHVLITLELDHCATRTCPQWRPARCMSKSAYDWVPDHEQVM